MKKNVLELKAGQKFIILGTDSNHNYAEVTFVENTAISHGLFVQSDFTVNIDGVPVDIYMTQATINQDQPLNKPVRLMAYDHDYDTMYFGGKEFMIGESIEDCVNTYSDFLALQIEYKRLEVAEMEKRRANVIAELHNEFKLA